MRRLLPAILVLATGCHHQYRLIDDNTLKPYKELPPRTQVPLPLPVVEHDSGFDTAYIEFNDQGKMFDPVSDPYQENKALDLIRTKKPATILLYVHGWNNNASENSADVTRFRAGLNYLSHQTSLKQPVLGIYIGWRGGTLKGGVLGPFTFLTYWSRKEGARRMGFGDLTRVLDELVQAAHEVPNVRFFAMGHSFGARVLEGALQKSVQFNSAIEALEKKDEKYQPRIDMVLLINPATDSMLTHQLVDRLRNIATKSENKGFAVRNPEWKKDICGPNGADRTSRVCHPYPLMVEISSEGDIPTGVVMPIANLVNWVPPMPLVAHPSARLRSAPFTASLRTHRVLKCPGASPSDDPCGPQADNVEFDFPMLATPVPAATGKPATPGKYYWGRVELLDARNTPFVWVLKVSRDISENHGDVWNENVAALVFGIIDPAASHVYTPNMLLPITSPDQPAAAAPIGESLFPQRGRGGLSVQDFASEPSASQPGEAHRPTLGPLE